MLCSLLVGQKEVGKDSCEVDFSAQEDRRKITQSPHPNHLPFHELTGRWQWISRQPGVWQCLLSLLKPSLSSHTVLPTCIAKGSDWLRLSPHLLCT